MKIKFSEPNINWQSFSDSKNQHEYGIVYVENKINEILNNVEKIDYLINNRKNIDTEDFINILTNICLFQLSHLDFLKILSNINDKKYIGIDEINTTMYHDCTDYKYNINYKIAYTHNSGINEYNLHEYYNIETISKLADKHEIIILEEIYNELWSQEDSINRIESYCDIPQFSIDLHYYNNSDWYHELKDYLLKSNNVYKEYLYDYVRSHVKKYMLEREMINYLNLFNTEIDILQKHSTDLYFGVTPCVEFTRECTNIFHEKGYSKRLKKLSDKYY